MDNIQMQGGGSDKWQHRVHVVGYWKARGFSVLSMAALILAWVATFRGTVFGLIAPHWYWSALILGLLSLCAKVVWAKDCDKTC